LYKKSIFICVALVFVVLLCSCGGSVTTPVKPADDIGEGVSETGYSEVESLAGDEGGAAEITDDEDHTIADTDHTLNGTHNVESAGERHPDPVAAADAEPVVLHDTVAVVTANTCVLSVRCDVLLANIGNLKPEKVELVPEDGSIFFSGDVVFYEGESVFNILQREMKQGRIHMEFVNVPLYNSAYIKGINNLYEFDCGELSGWTYKVNGLFPGCGPSDYLPEPGDVVEFVYSCDLGRDVGRGVE